VDVPVLQVNKDFVLVSCPNAPGEAASLPTPGAGPRDRARSCNTYRIVRRSDCCSRILASIECDHGGNRWDRQEMLRVRVWLHSVRPDKLRGAERCKKLAHLQTDGLGPDGKRTVRGGVPANFLAEGAGRPVVMQEGESVACTFGEQHLGNVDLCPKDVVMARTETGWYPARVLRAIIKPSGQVGFNLRYEDSNCAYQVPRKQLHRVLLEGERVKVLDTSAAARRASLDMSKQGKKPEPRFFNGRVAFTPGFTRGEFLHYDVRLDDGSMMADVAHTLISRLVERSEAGSYGESRAQAAQEEKDDAAGTTLVFYGEPVHIEAEIPIPRNAGAGDGVFRTVVKIVAQKSGMHCDFPIEFPLAPSFFTDEMGN
jgi:hypothetical protein